MLFFRRNDVFFHRNDDLFYRRTSGRSTTMTFDRRTTSVSRRYRPRKVPFPAAPSSSLQPSLQATLSATLATSYALQATGYRQKLQVRVHNQLNHNKYIMKYKKYRARAAAVLFIISVAFALALKLKLTNYYVNVWGKERKWASRCVPASVASFISATGQELKLKGSAISADTPPQSIPRIT